jgi:hypothetical protein
MTVSNVFVNQAVTISITNGFVSSPPPLDNLPVAILAQPRFTG